MFHSPSTSLLTQSPPQTPSYRESNPPPQLDSIRDINIQPNPLCDFHRYLTPFPHRSIENKKAHLPQQC